jgi:hypothetical protein
MPTAVELAGRSKILVIFQGSSRGRQADIRDEREEGEDWRSSFASLEAPGWSRIHRSQR